MELVEGESLHDAVLRSQREGTQVPVSKVATVVRQIGSALDTLHRSGVIHRDVKPANILLDPFRGRSVLVDVGIAIRPGERAAFAGTPGYVAPEAIESLKLDGSADVYGLAATVYELLTLRLPWPASDNVLTMLRMQREKPPMPPSAHRQALEPLDDVLLRALAVDPGERFPHVNDFASALCDALARVAALPMSGRGTTTLSGPDSTPEAESAIGNAPTMSFTPHSQPQQASTRGVVFRSIPRVIGPRNVAAWRLQLKSAQPYLSEALSTSAPPLGWLPTEWLVQLLSSDPPGIVDARELGRNLGRAAVRATFRRFFPVSAATLTPTGTVHALPQIWPHYHSWGRLHVLSAARERSQVRIQNTPRSDLLCAWVQGMFEQLLVLSGGDDVRVEHPLCETQGGEMCRFDATWVWVPRGDRAWR
jgi:serine/threonine protein kinase